MVVPLSRSPAGCRPAEGNRDSAPELGVCLRLRSNLQPADRVKERLWIRGHPEVLLGILGKVVHHGEAGPELSSTAPSPLSGRCAGSRATVGHSDSLAHDRTERHQDMPHPRRAGLLDPVHIHRPEPGPRARSHQSQRLRHRSRSGRKADAGRLQLQGLAGHQSRTERNPDGLLRRRPDGNDSRLRDEGHFPR
jgi:hypothetical protein